MSLSFTPSVCHVNLSAIARNFKKLGPPERLLPVIKSDAYGHGLTEVAQILGKNGATKFAVGLAEEGTILRQLGHQQDIVLLMGCLASGDWEQALHYHLTPCVGSFEDLHEAAELLSRYPGKTLGIAIKADTGMSRLGFSQGEIPQLLEFLTQNPALEPRLLISHLACADMPEESEFTARQAKIFDEFYQALSVKFPGLPRSLANSAATITGNECELLRPGLALYGGNPLPGPDELGLEWAMSVSTPVLQTRELAKGQSISYGRIFTADKPMAAAIVACGYATGFSRNLSNKAQAVINGKRVGQIGRICMSMAALDITDAGDVKKGDLAWLMGGDSSNPVTPTDIANWLDTISYEILCLMGSLNPRVYSR